MNPFPDLLPPRYRLVLCDLWGCVHNGVDLLPGVVKRLDRWRDEGRMIVFLTNAPRPSSAVVQQLAALGLPDRLNGHVVSSGDTGLAWMEREGRSRSCAFIGNVADAGRLEAAGLAFVREADADTIVCTGFDDRGFDIAHHLPGLRRMAAGGLEMLCFNPDRLVHRGDTAEPCAGAIADAYLALGGRVRQFGKPFGDIYDQAIRYARKHGAPSVNRDEAVAIGDSIATDYAGARAAGIDFIFVANGIDESAYRTDPAGIFERAAGGQAVVTRPVAIVAGLS